MFSVKSAIPRLFPVGVIPLASTYIPRARPQVTLCRPSGTWFYCLRLTPDLPFDFVQGRLRLSYAAAPRLGMVSGCALRPLGLKPALIQTPDAALEGPLFHGEGRFRALRRTLSWLSCDLEAGLPFPFEATARTSNPAKTLMRSDSSGAWRGGSGSGGFRLGGARLLCRIRSGSGFL